MTQAPPWVRDAVFYQIFPDRGHETAHLTVAAPSLPGELASIALPGLAEARIEHVVGGELVSGRFAVSPPPRSASLFVGYGIPAEAVPAG